MSWRRGDAPRGDNPGDHALAQPDSPIDLPRPWDAGPAPAEPDLLESGTDAAPSTGRVRRAVPAALAVAVPAWLRTTATPPAWMRRLRARLADADGLAGADGTADADDPAGAGGTARPDRGANRLSGKRWPAGALVVGLVLGGLLVHGYDDRLAEQARRDTISLAARVVPVDTAGGQGRDTWLLRVVVANRGARPWKLRSATLADTPLRSALRPVSTDVTLPAGKETWISIDVSGACAGGGLTRAPTALDVVLAATGRPERHERIGLADDTSLLLSSARQTCMDSNFALWAAAEQVGSARIDKNGLFIPVRFRSNWSPAWEVSAVRNAGAGLAATVAATLPIRFTNGFTPVTTVRWTITDCVQAKALGYTGLRLRTTLTLPGATRSIEVTTTLSGVLTEAVSGFVQRACA